MNETNVDEVIRPRGRPRKYATEEDRLAAQAAKARFRYSQRKDIINSFRRDRYRQKKAAAAEAAADDDE